MTEKRIVEMNAVRMVEQKKIPYTEHEYEWDESRLNAPSVARQFSESQSRIFKTLITVDNVTGPLVAAISGEVELNLKELARVSGNKKVEVLYLGNLEATTGYIRGGYSPIGMKKLFPTYLDQIAENYDQVTVSADGRELQMELAPQGICVLTNEQLADIKQ